MGIRKPAGYPFYANDTWTSKDGRVTKIMEMERTHLERTIAMLSRDLGPDELVYEMNRALGKDVRAAFDTQDGHKGLRNRYRQKRNFWYSNLVRMREELQWRDLQG